jgi:hypothetical protein
MTRSADYTVAAARISEAFVIEVAARGRRVKHVGGGTLPALIHSRTADGLENLSRLWTGLTTAPLGSSSFTESTVTGCSTPVDGDVSVSAQPARPHAGTTTNVDGNVGFPARLRTRGCEVGGAGGGAVSRVDPPQPTPLGSTLLPGLR